MNFSLNCPILAKLNDNLINNSLIGQGVNLNHFIAEPIIDHLPQILTNVWYNDVLPGI